MTKPIIYGSGLSRSPSDLADRIHRHQAIGVVWSDCTGPVIDLLHQAIERHLPVFVDSGAFNELSSGIEPDWEEYFRWLLELARPHSWPNQKIVATMPDKVGDFPETCLRLHQWEPQIRRLQLEVSRMFCVQRWENNTILQNWETMTGGFDHINFRWLNPVVGLPYNQVPWTDAEILEFLTSADRNGNKARRVHLLGGGSNAVFKLADKAAAHPCQLKHLSGDSRAWQNTTRAFGKTATPTQVALL